MIVSSTFNIELILDDLIELSSLEFTPKFCVAYLMMNQYQSVLRQWELWMCMHMSVKSILNLVILLGFCLHPKSNNINRFSLTTKINFFFQNFNFLCNFTVPHIILVKVIEISECFISLLMFISSQLGAIATLRRIMGAFQYNYGENFAKLCASF